GFSATGEKCHRRISSHVVGAGEFKVIVGDDEMLGHRNHGVPELLRPARECHHLLAGDVAFPGHGGGFYPHHVWHCKSQFHSLLPIRSEIGLAGPPNGPWTEPGIRSPVAETERIGVNRFVFGRCSTRWNLRPPSRSNRASAPAKQRKRN